eukprot:COSAG01_NODE_48200_length_383_cov_0.915493_1_plen_75_part_10
MLVLDDRSGFLIVHPDTLVTGTRIANSFKCRRMAVLGALVTSNETSPAAVNGSMLHDLFEYIVLGNPAADDTSAE